MGGGVGSQFVCLCVGRGGLTHLLKPMSALLSLAVLIGCTNQVEGRALGGGGHTPRVTNILLTGGRRATLAVSPEDPAGSQCASRK